MGSQQPRVHLGGLAPSANYLKVYTTTSVCDVFIAQHRVQFLEGLHTPIRVLLIYSMYVILYDRTCKNELLEYQDIALILSCTIGICDILN